MAKPIYAYSNYKLYLRDRIQAEPKGGHGVRYRLAQAMQCQPAYVSHVLNGERDLSLDQVEAATRFFGLNPDETEYLIWLVELKRAGTPEARKFFERLLEAKQSKVLELKSRVAIREELSEADKAMYYSRPLHAIIHMLVTIPEYRTPQKLAERLQLPLASVRESVDFLKSAGLISEHHHRLEITQKHLFLDKSSPFIAQHHANWRLQAIQQISFKSQSDDLHLSLLVSLSEKDLKSLRRRFAEWIAEASMTIKASKEETVACLNLDFFEI